VAALIEWEPGSATTHTDLLAPGPGARIGVARTSGALAGRTADAVAWVLAEGGSGRLRAGDDTADVDGRADVFDGPGWSAVVGPHTAFSVDGDLRTTVVWRRESRALPTRLVDPADVADEERGEGSTRRHVRTYVAEGPLIVGETLNPPGGWSSYPPHRHEHEEIYLYRFDPPEGFGLQMRSESDDDERAVVVRDGRIERITSGWHPVVAAPGFTLYYLWALAGADVLDTEVDTRYAM
jgi:5-deoxy-glucuronate isomerase